jgi:hypothetical protein
MPENVKRRAILYLGLAVLLTILIAASLGRARFYPGLPMPVTDGQSVAVALPELPEIKLQVNTFFFVFFSIFLAALIIVTFYRLMHGTSWKRLALDFLLYTLGASVAFGALALFIAALPRSTGVAQLPAQLPARVTAPLGQMPPFVLWLAGFVLLAGAVALGGGFILARRRPGRKLSLLEAEAHRARQALLDGQEVKDVILNCYRQMCLALQQERASTGWFS